MTADLAEMFSTEDFAVSASFTHGVTTTTVPVHFFEPSDEALAALLGNGFVTSNPHLLCRSTDSGSMAPGDRVVVGAVTYYIRTTKPNGDCVTLIELSRDA